MQYKIYFKGTECRIPGFDMEDSKQKSHYPPYEFDMNLSVDLANKYIECEVEALNAFSANALEDATPYISRYAGRFAPNSTIDLSNRRSKNGHKMWANKANTRDEFDETRHSNSASFGISLYSVDDRLSNPYYGVYQPYPPRGAQPVDELQTSTLIVAFRVALVSPGSRTIAVSDPCFVEFNRVGGGDYQGATITTFEDFCHSHNKFREE